MKSVLSLRERIGLLKSVAIYYWKPFNQRRLRKFYSQFISAGDLCFDVGAHVGNRTIAWAALGARVIAIEPQPACIRYLRKKCARHDKITIVEAAVGHHEGVAPMYVNAANPTISTLSDDAWRTQLAKDARYPIRWEAQIEVQVTTLDALIGKYGLPAFCKIDVENFEAEALYGLHRPLPVLSFEYYPPRLHSALDCLDRLAELGDYEYNWSFGESLRLNALQWVDYESIKKIISEYTTRYQYGDIYARLRHG